MAMSGTGEQCTAHNGSYYCQHKGDHAGVQHYSYYIKDGKLCIAKWVDQWSRIVTSRTRIDLPAPE
jgi:hypothetical protein